MSEAPVYQLLVNDLALNALGLTSTTVLESLNHSSPEYRPFAVLNWGASDPAAGGLSARFLDVWVYDEPGSYAAVVNPALARIRQILCVEKFDYTYGGQHFATATWRGDSPNLYDDIFKCVTRYASFSVV